MARTNRDASHLAKLRDWHRDNGTMPSFSQVTDMLGFGSKTAVTRLVGRLSATGHLDQAEDGRLRPGSRFFEVAIADEKVRAGIGEAIVPEIASDSVSINGLLDVRSNNVLVKVKGDSMREAGILEGDYALVDREAKFHPGDIVLAYVDGNFTLKELRYRSGRPSLVAHDGKQTTIEVREHLDVLGVLRGIVRTYSHQRIGRKGASR